MDKQREMFEAWYQQSPFAGEHRGFADYKHFAYAAWQAAIAAQSEVPLGWKLVPIVPTEKMVNEGSCARSLPGPHYIDSSAARQCWEYMISMSPRPAK